MKLLRLKILSENGFRSLCKDFEICFHQAVDFKLSDTFRPLCFVGLNGCGKSNVLEALSLIFYHMELCVGIHLPHKVLEKSGFAPERCIIDAFELEYLILEKKTSDDIESSMVKVTIIKKVTQQPLLYIQDNKSKKKKIDLHNLTDGKASLAKQYLPTYVVAYSSGENETLSIPFIKSRFVHLYEFKEATIDGIKHYLNPENGLIYVDVNMSQAILLCCLLFEDEKTLQSLSSIDNTGILGVTQFRMKLHDMPFLDSYGNKHNLFDLFKTGLFEKLDACSTMAWYDNETQTYYFDFWVNDATKQAFKFHFHTGMECFQIFRLLYELNMFEFIEEKSENLCVGELSYSDSINLTGTFESENFAFMDFFLLKQVGKSGVKKEMLLRNLSDGEHQFIHTMAICLLLKDANALVLLDEPETHFNPSWRSRFVSILDRALKDASSSLEQKTQNQLHLMKDVLITTHSPFIISDCHAEDVIIMDKDDSGNTHAQRASDLNIKTYGSSTSLIQAKIFKNTDTIGSKAYEELKKIKKQSHKDKIQLLNEVNALFGDSLEKLMILNAINEK